MSHLTKYGQYFIISLSEENTYPSPLYFTGGYYHDEDNQSIHTSTEREKSHRFDSPLQCSVMVGKLKLIYPDKTVNWWIMSETDKSKRFLTKG